MRALTLWQPWAAAVTHAGTPVAACAPPPRSVIGTRIAIHAAQRVAYDGTCVRSLPARARGILVARYGWEVISDFAAVLPRSVIVCTAVVSRCVRTGDVDPIERSDWFTGPYGWVLETVIALPTPIPCRGRQGVWVVPSDIEAAVRAAEGSAT